MKKTLIYHLYCGKDFATNIANEVHYRCLSKYIGMFDEARFVISVDDFSDENTIKDGIEWVMSLPHKGEKTIKIRKNTKFFEVETFKSEFLDCYENIDGYVFFAHNKGTTNIKNNGDNIFAWICCLYYYNLEFVNEVDGIFSGTMRAPDVFYGAMMMYFSKERQSVVHAMPNNLSGLEYSGTFYWINVPKYRNCVKMGVIKDVEPDSRFFAEEYPGMFFDRYAYGCGMASHNDALIDAMEFNPYYADGDSWKRTIGILGDEEGFYKFITEINSEIDEDNRFHLYI